VSVTPPAVDGVSHHYVEARGVRFHVAEAGAGDDVVVLLHGWPQHWWSWRKVLPALTVRHRVLMPDLRGFGWSEAPGHGYDPRTFAADTLALMDGLGVERFKLGGHDWGGSTAFAIALEHPERVERLVAMDTVAPWLRINRRTIASSWRSGYSALLAMPGIGPHVAKRGAGLLMRFGGGRHVFPAAEVEVYAERLREPERIRATVLLYRGYQRIAWRMLLRRRGYADGRLAVPTLVLHGTDDRPVPLAWLVGIEDHGDDVVFASIADCGHFIAEEQPELVGARLAEFFA
jgi:pimeloyl-ACP methyl ester carboxylesterase